MNAGPILLSALLMTGASACLVYEPSPSRTTTRGTFRYDGEVQPGFLGFGSRVTITNLASSPDTFEMGSQPLPLLLISDATGDTFHTPRVRLAGLEYHPFEAHQTLPFSTWWSASWLCTDSIPRGRYRLLTESTTKASYYDPPILIPLGHLTLRGCPPVGLTFQTKRFVERMRRWGKRRRRR